MWPHSLRLLPSSTGLQGQTLAGGRTIWLACCHLTSCQSTESSVSCLGCNACVLQFAEVFVGGDCVQDDPAKCGETCGAFLECGHPCTSTCGSCYKLGTAQGAQHALLSVHSLLNCWKGSWLTIQDACNGAGSRICSRPPCIVAVGPPKASMQGGQLSVLAV